MEFHKANTTQKLIHVWYNPDTLDCSNGTLEQYELQKSKSNKHDEFALICQLENDQNVLTELTNSINEVNSSY